MISMYFGAVTQDISAVSGVCLFFLRAFQLLPRFLVLLGSAGVRGFDTNVARIVFGLSLSCRLAFSLLLIRICCLCACSQ